MFGNSHYHSFPVIVRMGILKGMVSLTDLEANISTAGKDLVAANISTTKLIVAYPDESLHEVLHRLGEMGSSPKPVVDRKTSSHQIGVLRRNDIINAYTKLLQG
jgi:CIC family chloride channel protein